MADVATSRTEIRKFTMVLLSDPDGGDRMRELKPGWRRLKS
jgi:hypothetical protein